MLDHSTQSRRSYAEPNVRKKEGFAVLARMLTGSFFRFVIAVFSGHELLPVDVDPALRSLTCLTMCL